MEERQAHTRKGAQNGWVTSFDGKMSTHSSWTLVQKNAIEIADDVVRYMVGTQAISTIRPPNSYAKTMRRTVKDVAQKYEDDFNGMARKLGFTNMDVTTALGSILDEVFSDGRYNWGRMGSSSSSANLRQPTTFCGVALSVQSSVWALVRSPQRLLSSNQVKVRQLCLFTH